MKIVRKHVIFKGRVQGVGFRYYCYGIASKMKLTGWIRNLYNGDVEMEVQGDSREIEMYLYKIQEGDGFIRVDEMEVMGKEVLDESSFVIRSY